MPHVKDLRRTQYRPDTHSQRAESVGQIIVFAAPPNKMFIEAINLFEMMPPQGDVRTGKFWFLWMADCLIEAVSKPSVTDSLLLTPRNPAQIIARNNSLFGNSFGGLLIKVDATTRPCYTSLPPLQVLEQVIWRKNAVRVRKKQVGRRTG
jgi:hypothetical protein